MDPEQEASRRVGTTLCNKWTLEKLLGTGGMAAVYVAAHKIGRREAIKILHPDIARDADLRARFEQEAHAVNRFKHPGAVEIRDIDVAEDGSPFLVMELLEGQPLSDLARQPGGVPVPDLLRLVDELLDVLAAAHAQGIIHRDIKPDNLFVLSDGRLKVLDFGIARVRAGASPKLQTKRGTALGTAPYMPPEQIKGLEIDARADLFAVGATMFRLIARRRIHEATNETETLVKMASEPAPRLASVAPDAPPDVCVVVDRALMFQRENRYPDALTMQRDVRAVRQGEVPTYAHARLLEGTPAPSALRVPSVVQPPMSYMAGPVSGDGPTAFAGDEGVTRVPTPGLETTAAASPVAIVHSVGRDPLSSAAPTLDRATVPMNGAHGLANGAPPSSSLEQSLPLAEATPPSGGVFRPPGAGSTMRSALGTDAAAAARPPGQQAPAATQILAGPPSVRRDERTRPAGAEALAPGATVPVVDLARSRGEREPNLVLLILVGIAFAAIGVGLTLWIMLRGARDGGNADAGGAPTADAPEPPEAWPTAPKRTTPRPVIAPAQPRNPTPVQPQQPQPQQPQPQPFFPIPGFVPPPPSTAQPSPQPTQTSPSRGPDKPGKGHGRGHGKRD